MECVTQKLDKTMSLIVARIQEINSTESRMDGNSEGQKEHSTPEAKKSNKKLVPNASSAQPTEKEFLEKVLAELKEMRDICDGSQTAANSSWLRQIITGLISWILGSSKTIQVLLIDQTPSTKVFMRELQTEVKGFKTKIELKFIDSVSKLQQDEKFIVVCPSPTRLEPDIDFSLQNVDKSKILAAVVLHQVRKGQEPAMSTQSRIGQEKKYDGITFIDMAFDTDHKIYSCDMNKKAENDLKAIVEKA